MTNRIEEIKQRADAASPGPWKFVTHNLLQDANEDEVLATIYGESAKKADAEFIEHSRSDMPYLLEQLAIAQLNATKSLDVHVINNQSCEIARLTKELTIARYMIEHMMQTLDTYNGGSESYYEEKATKRYEREH